MPKKSVAQRMRQNLARMNARVKNWERETKAGGVLITNLITQVLELKKFVDGVITTLFRQQNELTKAVNQLRVDLDLKVDEYEQYFDQTEDHILDLRRKVDLILSVHKH